MAHTVILVCPRVLVCTRIMATLPPRLKRSRLVAAIVEVSIIVVPIIEIASIAIAILRLLVMVFALTAGLKRAWLLVVALIDAGLLGLSVVVAIIPIAHSIERSRIALGPSNSLAVAVHLVVAVLRKCLSGHDYPIVVLGMLEVVFAKHQISRANRVSRQRHVFFGDVLGGSANLDIGSA